MIYFILIFLALQLHLHCFVGTIRHVVRNVYAFQLEPEKLRLLVESAPLIFTQIKAECLAFASFLEHQAQT